MATDDVLERAEHWLRLKSYPSDDPIVVRIDTTEIIGALAAEVRELRKDRERLDWILDDDFARYDPRRKEYRDRIDTREDIDGLIAAEEA